MLDYATHTVPLFASILNFLGNEQEYIIYNSKPKSKMSSFQDLWNVHLPLQQDRNNLLLVPSAVFILNILSAPV
jgi:hypothetical protein